MLVLLSHDSVDLSISYTGLFHHLPYLSPTTSLNVPQGKEKQKIQKKEKGLDLQCISTPPACAVFQEQHTQTHLHSYSMSRLQWDHISPLQGLKDFQSLISSRDEDSLLLRFSTSVECSRQFNPRREKVLSAWINKREQWHHKANRGSSAVMQHRWSSSLES